MLTPNLPSHRTSKKRRLRLVFLVAFVLISTASFLFVYFWFPTKVSYWIQEQYLFEIPEGSQTTVAMGALLPTDGPSQQVSRIAINWPGSHQIGTRLSPPGEPGVQTIYLQPVAASGQVEAKITYQVTLKVGTFYWQAEPVEAYLQPSPGIECGAPEISALVTELDVQDGEPDVYRLYRYTAGALEWPQGSRINIEPSALQALTSGEGGCNEFSNLLVALNRASGNPAYTISGLIFPPMLPPFITSSSTWSHTAGAHAWTAASTSQGWTYMDASWASQAPDFLYFGRNNGQHLAYAEQDAEQAAYLALTRWAESQGSLVGAMSAPLKFAAAAQAEAVQFTPGVKVRVTNDGRLINALVFLVFIILISRYLDRKWFS